jgi:hypothetical protein
MMNFFRVTFCPMLVIKEGRFGSQEELALPEVLRRTTE